MTEQWIRKIQLVVAAADGHALDLSELRIRFHTQRSGLQTPNTSEITIYNVSDATAKKLKGEFTRVVLSAGYENGVFGTLFDGTITQVRQGRESQTDTFVAVSAADSDIPYNYGTVNTSLAAGSNINDHLNAYCAGMGVKLGYVPELPGPRLSRGKVMSGLARDYLRTSTQNAAATWSLQDGALELCPINGWIPTAEAIVLTSATGLIGMPEQTAAGINVKALLNPNIKPDRRIQLDNATIQRIAIGQTYDTGTQLEQQAILAGVNQYTLNLDGFYVVKGLEHSGDTRGQEWYTQMVCLAIDPTAYSQQLINAGY